MKATVALGSRPDPRLPLPLYVQLRELLRARIMAGDPPVGHKLASEAELCARYEVSRTVVRQALSELAQEGLILKHKGRVTVVKGTSIEEKLGPLKSFTEEILAQGRVPSARVVESRFGSLPTEAVVALGLHPDERALVIERLRFADGDPICYELTVWPEFLAVQLTNEDLDKAVFYRLLERRFGILLGEGEQMMTAIAAPAKVARLLDVRPGSPLLQVERTTFTNDGRPILWGRSLYHAGKYHYRVRLKRQTVNIPLLSMEAVEVTGSTSF
jgi:GntR family transcriptional regulator